jgi:tryptophan halogenase
VSVDKIVVVGGGSAGWMTASTLIKAFPNKKIYVIESKNVPLVGVGESTLGEIRRWTRFIGLNEKDFFKQTDASYKLSIKFTDFYKKDSGSFHYPFGQPAVDKNRNPFHDWHIKKYIYPDTPVTDFVECLFPASALFTQNKYSPNILNNFDNFDHTNDVAYHFDAVKFGKWLKDFVCLPNGVKHIESTVIDIHIEEDLGIKFLKLENGETITADLFIDCTGFKSLLLGQTLKEPFTSFENLLPNNGAWATRIPYKNKEKELEGYTNCTAIGNGWCWNIPLYSRIGAGYVHSTKYITKEQALDEFKEYLMSNKMVVPRTKDEVESLEYRYIDMRVGLHERTFVKNVVAIGLSAGFIEPLESNGLFTVHKFLFKLIDILQRNDISQFDRDMYNSSAKTLFESFTKFVSLHYLLSHRDDTEYWKNIKNGNQINIQDEVYDRYYYKSGAFYDLVQRYMDHGKHPLDRAGITYIATGMNLNMMNNSRAENEYFTTKIPLKQIADFCNADWELKKQKWKNNAQNAPSLYEYLKNTYFDGQE